MIDAAGLVALDVLEEQGVWVLGPGAARLGYELEWCPATCMPMCEGAPGRTGLGVGPSTCAEAWYDMDGDGRGSLDGAQIGSVGDLEFDCAFAQDGLGDGDGCGCGVRNDIQDEPGAYFNLTWGSWHRRSEVGR